MHRVVGFALASLLFLAAIVRSPLSLAWEHGGSDDATPHASPSAMAMSGTGAAYVIIRNTGPTADRLVGGSTTVARDVELHEAVATEGMMEMRPLAEGLVIPPGDEVALEPGGYHVMLIGLREDLTNGKVYDLTLQFERAGDVTVPVTVRPRAQPAPGATPAPVVNAGAIAIEDAWSRPAPALGSDSTDMATPAATPAP